jgi:hypothetical protein
MKKRVSKIPLDDSRFSLAGLSVGRFLNLGKQYKDPSISHIAYLKQKSISNTCYVQKKTKLSGYCSYSLIGCDNLGLIGAVFYAYDEKTVIEQNCLTISRKIQSDRKQQELFTPLFTLECLDLLIYTSNYGSTIVIPSTVKYSPLLVQST